MPSRTTPESFTFRFAPPPKVNDSVSDLRPITELETPTFPPIVAGPCTVRLVKPLMFTFWLHTPDTLSTLPTERLANALSSVLMIPPAPQSTLRISAAAGRATQRPRTTAATHARYRAGGSRRETMGPPEMCSLKRGLGQ